MTAHYTVDVQARIHRRWLLALGVWAVRLRMRKLGLLLAGMTCVDIRVSTGRWQHVCVRRVMKEAK